MQASDGVALAGTSTMLNQKALTDWIGASLEKELADTIKLVIAWPYNSLYRFRLALFFFSITCA